MVSMVRFEGTIPEASSADTVTSDESAASSETPVDPTVQDPEEVPGKRPKRK